MNLLSVDSISKRFGRIEALRSVTFKFGSGVLGLIGPNGSGKTTLIRIIIGHLKPDQGSCRLFGFDSWRNSSSVKQKIGVLHEKPSYPRHVHCGQYLQFVGKIYDVKNPSAKADEMLERMGLPPKEVANRPIGELSAGMLQRLGICQALMSDRVRLVLLDEPTSSLDVTGRMELLSLIRKLHEELEVSFLISSHILSELERVCDSIVIIYNGEALDKGSIPELANRHTSNEYIVSPPTPDVQQKLREMDGIQRLDVEANRIRVTINTNIRGSLGRLRKSLPTSVSVQRASSLEDVFTAILRTKREGRDNC